MFWKGKVSIFLQIEAFLKQSEVALVPIEPPQIPHNMNPGNCTVHVSKSNDIVGIAKLLNEWFEEPTSKTKANVTPEWVHDSYTLSQAIWIVARDSGGTVRGCVSSFRSSGPYPSSIANWGIVDWYCVHPLWRSKGLGSSLLETLDLVTYRLGRKAHIFLKEGLPLSLPHVPIYSTWLKCRKAGSKEIKQMSEDTGILVYPYHEVERSTGLPLTRIEGLYSDQGLSEWEEALDKVLPECWVFVSGDCKVDYKRGWQTDSLISMYAFRWSPGKWLGSRISSSII